MNQRIHHSWLFITLALLFGMVLSGAQLIAQQSAPPPDQQSASPADNQKPSQENPPQQPGQASGQSGQQAPDSQAEAQSSQGQTFTGTIVKSGDKYVLQDPSGKSYDVDHQDLVKTYEGKQVRVRGTLDSASNMIHMK